MAKNWAKLEYTKSAIKKAGKSLVDSSSSDAEIESATLVLGNWRAVHTYPMHAALMLLRGKAAKIDKNSNVVQRLKRSSSILLKLQRFNSMKLNQVQDIAGCRAVVGNQRHANKLKNELLKSRSRHEIWLQKDYVTEPKETGYRGYHLIVKYGATKQEYAGLLVEIQIRTKYQHAWATAVEVAGTFIGRSLKTGESHAQWDEYFILASRKIAQIEKQGDSIDRADLLRLGELNGSLGVTTLLTAISATVRHINKKMNATRKNSYYLLKLDTRNAPSSSKVEISTYPQNALEAGTAKYGELEREFKDEPRVDIVLVAAESVDSLKKAYPNYFADTKVFLELMSRSIPR